MLRNPTMIKQQNKACPISAMIAEVNGNSPELIRHEEGVLEIGHFSLGNLILEKINDWPAFEDGFGSYGVCDNYKQVLEQCPELTLPGRLFVLSVTPVVKANQSDWGGWRWHKWGEYIGEGEPTTEYLYDEPDFEKVYVYHIYEFIPQK